LEHLLYPARALKQILGILEPSGMVLLTVPNGRIDNFGGHINFWSPESWKVFLEEFGNLYEIETGLMEENRAIFALIKNRGVL